ncbi:MAG: hypothetical protein IIU58_02050 [Clostridia bacterium]|nr:hypothetical protein [Clostridia bacterium]
MKQAKLHFSSEAEIQNYVDACEAEYHAEVQAACATAAAGGSIITLSGPTCSGKTTTARILDDAFLRLGKELHTISIDDFYFDRDELQRRAKERGEPLDYDSPSTIDLVLFGKVIEQIEARGRVLVPRFDFQSGKRDGFVEFSSDADDIFLFEGIQAVYPELTRYLAAHSFTSLFISVEESLDCGGVVFEPRELRFMRRLVRDARTRGASAEFTYSLWGGVTANEDMHIYPNLGGVHCRIDSTLGYEVSVLKPYVLALLDTIASDSLYFAGADALRQKLKHIPTIDEKYVPDGSVFREFIGEKE